MLYQDELWDWREGKCKSEQLYLDVVALNPEQSISSRPLLFLNVAPLMLLALQRQQCRFTSSCSSGVTETNKCPGPDTFKCCMPGSSTPNPPGTYPPPTIPSASSGCKAVAIDGAKKVSAQFPGKIREIGCIRKCEAGDSSDHCDGMANDLMVTEGGVRSPIHSLSLLKSAC